MPVRLSQLSWGRLWTITLFFQFPPPLFISYFSLPLHYFIPSSPPQKKKHNNNRISFCPVRLIPLYFRVELRVLGLISKCCIWFRGDTDDAVISGCKINMALEAVAKERTVLSLKPLPVEVSDDEVHEIFCFTGQPFLFSDLCWLGQITPGSGFLPTLQLQFS